MFSPKEKEKEGKDETVRHFQSFVSSFLYPQKGIYVNAQAIVT